MIRITIGPSLKSSFKKGDTVHGCGRTGVIEDVYNLNRRIIGNSLLDGFEMALVDFGNYKGEVALSLLTHA